MTRLRMTLNARRRLVRMLWWLAACALVAAAGSPAARAADRATESNVARVPALMGRSVVNGRVLYATYCASCHGVRGKGDGPDAALCDRPPRDLREGFLARYSDADLVRRVLDGKPLQLVLDPAALRGRATEVETIAAHVERLPTIDWRRVEHGLEVYVEHCELCHGPYGRPPASVPPGVRRPRDLSDGAFQRDVADAALRTLVRHGRGGMPALEPRWTAEDLDALVAFVRLLSPGYERYSRYCASCHGDDGRGSFADAGVRPTVVFDRAYFAGHDRDHVRGSVWHMVDEKKPSMPHFHSALTEAQARAIIQYLKGGE